MAIISSHFTLQLLKGMYTLLAVASARGWCIHGGCCSLRRSGGGGRAASTATAATVRAQSEGRAAGAGNESGGGGSSSSSSGGSGGGTIRGYGAPGGSGSGADGDKTSVRFSLSRLRWNVRLCLALLSASQLIELVGHASVSSVVPDGAGGGVVSALDRLRALAGDASIASLASNVADILSVLALSAVLEEVRSVETLITMLGPENAVRTLEAVFVYGVAAIGQALADPAALLGWLDASTPSPGVTCILLALARVGAVVGAVRGAMSQALFQPLLERIWIGAEMMRMSPVLAEAMLVVLLLSAAVNYEWLRRATELHSRHRIFLLLPPSKHSETIVKITKLVESYESHSRQMGSVVGRVGTRIQSAISIAAWGAAHPILAAQAWWRRGGSSSGSNGGARSGGSTRRADGSESTAAGDGSAAAATATSTAERPDFEFIELDDEVRSNALAHWPQLPPLLGEGEGDSESRLASSRARVTAWWQHWTGV